MKTPIRRPKSRLRLCLFAGIAGAGVLMLSSCSGPDYGVTANRIATGPADSTEPATGIDAMVFPAPRSTYDIGLPGLILLPAQDGSRHFAALWVPKPGATTAILYFHGNGEDLGCDAGMLADLRDMTGCSVLAVDYPGYGLSPGRPSESGCYAAADAAFDALQTKFGYKPESIVAFGRSLGTGVAVDLASRHPVKGLVLISPFTSVFRVVPIGRFVPGDRFDSLAKIPRVKCPLLIVHGDHDEVIPVSHGEKLYEAAENAASASFLPIPGGRHNEGVPGTEKAEEFRKAIMAITGG